MKKKAVIYMRMSTDKQEYSIESQERLINSYAKSNNYIIVDKYTDEGISGKSALKRPAFLKMIDDSTNNTFDAVLIYDSSRFARNLEESIVYKSLLKKNGVDLISITEPIFDDDTSLVTDALFGAMNEMYVRKLSKNVKRGMEQRAIRGDFTGTVPLGYTVDENFSLVINEKEIELIKYIFESIKSGKSYYSISRNLNDKGFRTNKGNLFQPRRVQYIASNPLYKGYLNTSFGIKKGKHQPIIQESLFNEVQEIIQDRKSKYKRKAQPPERGKHWLSGILRCKYCNSAFSYKICYGGRKDRFFCSSISHNHSLKVETLEQLVISNLKDIYNNPEDFYSLNIKPRTLEPIINYDAEIIKLTQSLKRAKKAYLSEIDTLEEYRENKISISKEIEYLKNLKKDSCKNIFNRKAFSEKLINAINVLDSDSDLEEKKTASHNLIEKIVVDAINKHIELYFFE